MKKFKLSSLVFISILFFLSCSQKASFDLTAKGFASAEKITLKTGILDSNRYYVFSQENKDLLKNFYKQNGTAALKVTLEEKNISSEEALTSYICFLQEGDLNSSLKLKEKPVLRKCVSFSKEDFQNGKLSILFSLSRSDFDSNELPAGFFIESGFKVSVLSAEIVEASSGVDYSGDVPLYAFSAMGGVVSKNSRKAELLSNMSFSYSDENSDKSLMPVISIGFVPSADNNGKYVRAYCGGERFTLRSTSDKVSIPLAALKNPYSYIEITENPELVNSILIEPSDRNLLKKAQTGTNHVLKPYKVDPGLIMSWPSSRWRGTDYELFEWNRFEGILFFDTADYSVQNDFFRRLAFFVEKKETKGTLQTDAQLEGKHGYNAHDYRAYDLAKFYEKARKEKFPLNEKELLLKEILVENGVIVISQDGTVSEGRGAVISISQESAGYLRTTFVAHEGWHGIYFVDQDFRNAASTIFYTLKAADPESINFLTRYFQVNPSLNYDTEDEYLFKNEFMAYMLQKPVNAVEDYYVKIANWRSSQTLIKKESDYIIATKASGFVGASQMFEDYVMEKYNLAAGRVWLISRN